MYWARGAAAGDVRDDGMLSPTAAAASIAMAPELVVPAARAGRIVPGTGWFDTDRLGIDQGPVVIMLENYRSGLVWSEMRKNPWVVRGLCHAGFRGGWLEAHCR